MNKNYYEAYGVAEDMVPSFHKVRPRARFLGSRILTRARAPFQIYTAALIWKFAETTAPKTKRRKSMATVLGGGK